MVRKLCGTKINMVLSKVYVPSILWKEWIVPTWETGEEEK